MEDRVFNDFIFRGDEDEPSVSIRSIEAHIMPELDKDGLPMLTGDAEKDKEIEELRALVISERGHG